MASLPEMIELWREAPEAPATIDLCNRLVRQSSKPGQQNVVSSAIMTEVIEEAMRLHGDNLEVMLAVGGLCLTTGMPERAEAVLAGLPDHTKSDPRLSKLLGKIRLHLGVHAAKSSPPSYRSSGPPSDRGPGAAAMLADLNRRVGQRPSGTQGAVGGRVATPSGRPYAGPPSTAPVPQPAPAPHAHAPASPQAHRSPRGGFEIEDPIPPEEHDVHTKAHTYSPQELLAAIEREEAEVDDRAATRAREMVPASVASGPPPSSSRHARPSVEPGHWSQSLMPSDPGEDNETSSYDSSDLLDEIQPTGFRRAAAPPPSAPRAPMMSVSEQPTAAKFEWQRYLDQDAPTAAREAPASARELMRAIEDEATGHEGPTAMRDQWDGSTMSGMTREGPTAAIRQPLFDEDPSVATQEGATRPIALAPPFAESPGDAGFSAADIERAGRDLEAMNTFGGGEESDLVDYGNLGDEVDEVEVVLPQRSRRSPMVESARPPEEAPFQHHVDPNELARGDDYGRGDSVDMGGVDVSYGDERLSAGAPFAERPSSSRRSGDLGFSMPAERFESTERMPAPAPPAPAPGPSLSPHERTPSAAPYPKPATGLGAALEADPPWSRAPRREASGSSGIRSVLIGFFGVVVLVVGGATLYFYLTAKDATKTAASTAVVDRSALRAALLQGGQKALDEVDRAWSEAGPSGSSDPELAKLRLQERAFRVLDFEEPVASLKGAMEAARAAGVGGSSLAFADLVSAIHGGDVALLEQLISKYDADESLRADAIYQFAAGAALEVKGDEGAIARFQNAVGSEPGFKAAEVRLIRAMLLYGDTAEGERRAAAFRDTPEDSPRARALKAVAALSAVGSGSGRAEDVPALDPSLPLPRWLRWAPSAASFARERDKAKQLGHWKAAFDKLDVPMAALLLGDLALATGMDDRAILAADHALTTGQHPRALRLLGKAALQTGRLERLAVEGDNVAAAELRAILAYERGEFAKVAEIARAGFSTPGILLRLQRMQGQARLSADQIDRLRQPDVVGGELVLIDAALDAGDVELAKRTMSTWNDAATHPLKSRRWARLLRYDGDFGNASVALDVSAALQPSLIEKVLVAGEIEVMQKFLLESLDPTKLEEGYFLQAFLHARQKSLEAARGAIDKTTLPGDGAPLSLRVVAALALAELSDPRGKPLCEALVVTFPRNPDVLAASERYGIRVLAGPGADPVDPAAPSASASATPGPPPGAPPPAAPP
jgi:hypothetical protein